MTGILRNINEPTWSDNTTVKPGNIDISGTIHFSQAENGQIETTAII